MTPEPLDELRYALEHPAPAADAADLRTRVLSAAMTERAPGHASEPVGRITGTECFRRVTSTLRRLLDDLHRGEWERPTIRDLTVQELVGHLIGVETGFAAALSGDDSAASAHHVESTQAWAAAQVGRPPAATLELWLLALEETLGLVGSRGADERLRFHRIELALDAWMVVRAFECWTHQEDIERATGRPVTAPDAQVLRRMTELAVDLLPGGMALAGVAGGHVRLVLTGDGGGSWDVGADSGVVRAGPGRPWASHVTVDVVTFCRAVANRVTFESAAPRVEGHETIARELFAGASALALD